MPTPDSLPHRPRLVIVSGGIDCYPPAARDSVLDADEELVTAG
jgi:hypothetical protein